MNKLCKSLNDLFRWLKCPGPDENSLKIATNFHKFLPWYSPSVNKRLTRVKHSNSIAGQVSGPVHKFGNPPKSQYFHSRPPGAVGVATVDGRNNSGRFRHSVPRHQIKSKSINCYSSQPNATKGANDTETFDVTDDNRDLIEFHPENGGPMLKRSKSAEKC